MASPNRLSYWVLVFFLQKTEKKDHVLFDVSDNTGNMEILVFKKQNQINCEEGDKLRLMFFELSKSGEKLQLKSGVHSFITVGTTLRKVNRVGAIE